MMPQALTDLMEICNKTILALESCISAADLCEDLCENQKTCPNGAEKFVQEALTCIQSCHQCIKICDEMIIQFKAMAHSDHTASLDNAVKRLGECIKALEDGIQKCSSLQECRRACQDAREGCEKALIAVDECIESCEKHTAA